MSHVYKDEYLDFAHVEFLRAHQAIVDHEAVVPRVPSHLTFEVERAGAIIYDKTDTSLYYSNGYEWLPVGGVGEVVSVTNAEPPTETHISMLTTESPDPEVTVKTLVGGTNVTLVDNGTNVVVNSTGGGGGVESVTDAEPPYRDPHLDVDYRVP